MSTGTDGSTRRRYGIEPEDGGKISHISAVEAAARRACEGQKVEFEIAHRDGRTSPKISRRSTVLLQIWRIQRPTYKVRFFTTFN